MKLELGKTYSLSTQSKTTIIQIIDGIETRSTDFEAGTFSYKVLKNWDSLYLMEAMMTELSQQVVSGDDSAFYHSGMNDGSVASTIFNAIVNKPFRVVMRNDFNWKEVSGLDSIFFQAFDHYDIPKDKRQFLDSSVRELMKGFLKSDLFPVFVYPSKTVASNGIWSVYSESQHGVPTYDSCNYHLSEIDGDYVVVKSSGTIASLEDEVTNEGTVTTYHLKGTSSNTLRFDKKSGWIKRAEENSEMEGFALEWDKNDTEKRKVPMRIITEGFIVGY
jgi:hypothetical protein